MSVERIPVQNIYFLLCYAWNHVQEISYADVRTEGCDRLWDLMAKVLVRSTQQLVKRGLHRNYRSVRERRMLLKGKVLFAEEWRATRFGSTARLCEFDELSADILPNQIIRAAVSALLEDATLDKEVRGELRDVGRYFNECASVPLHRRLFRNLQLHRNMRHYRFVLSVCEFICCQMLPTRESGSSRFRDFRRDEATMGTLFENFVFNFYRSEQKEFRVSAPHISWAIDRERSSVGGVSLLPTMRSDVCLESAQEKRIIDCKFYKEAFQSRFENQKFISGHLYQLFAYLKNHERAPGWEGATGMLLYPMVNEPFDEYVFVHGHTIRVAAINLNQAWQYIHRDLLALQAAQTIDDSKFTMQPTGRTDI